MSSAGTGGVDGLQVQRTRLAWRRTVLAATVAALLCVRLALDARPAGLSILATGAVAGTWTALFASAEHRLRCTDQRRPARTLPLVALLPVSLALIGAVLVVCAG